MKKGLMEVELEKQSPERTTLMERVNQQLSKLPRNLLAMDRRAETLAVAPTIADDADFLKSGNLHFNLK